MRVFILAFRQENARELAHMIGIPPNMYRYLYHPDQLRGLRGATVLIDPSAALLKNTDQLYLMMKTRSCQVLKITSLADEWNRELYHKLHSEV